MNNLVTRATQAGKMLGAAAAITITMGATNALAHCNVDFFNASGEHIKHKVRVITKYMASGPKDAWENVCVPYGIQQFKNILSQAAKAGESLRNLKRYKAKIDMVCDGSWKGRWCSELQLRGDEYAAGFGKKVSFGSNTKGATIATTRGQATASFGSTRTANSNHKIPANDDVTIQGIISGNIGFRASKCQC